MRILRLVLLAYAALAAAGCATLSGTADSLDVPTATRALAHEIPAATPFFRFVNDMADSDDPPERAVYMTLVREGILAAYTAPSPLERHLQWHYRLTPAGSALVASWRRAEHGVYEIPVGTLQLAAVSGVEMISPGHAMVTYSYRLDLNAMGRLLLRDGVSRLAYYDPLKATTRDIRGAGAPASDVAEMTRYEDGWKSESWSF